MTPGATFAPDFGRGEWQIHPLVEALPSPGERRLAVRVTNDALRQVRAGHPWVYADSITSIDNGRVPAARSGDLAVIFDQRRSFAAIGLYDPDSPIALKILHAGSPLSIDAAFWRGQIDAALARRSKLFDRVDPQRGGYRMINGENDGLPGLVVDRYAEVLVVKLYSTAWFPHFRAVIDALGGASNCSTVVLRLARSTQRLETFGLLDGDVIAGSSEPGSLDVGPVPFLENGHLFESDVRRGQKTGWFLDQRANRARVQLMSSKARVLDVFCAAGGFGVHAAAGGARSVTSVDASAPALAAAVRNMTNNADDPAVAACSHVTIHGDADHVLRDLGATGERFDSVIVDPPSFTPRQNSVPSALAAYARLTTRALSVLEAGGLLVQASCSSRITPEDFYDTVVNAARRAGRPLEEVERTGHDIDHPVTFAQGGYLKAGFWRVP